MMVSSHTCERNWMKQNIVTSWQGSVGFYTRDFVFSAFLVLCLLIDPACFLTLKCCLAFVAIVC